MISRVYTLPGIKQWETIKTLKNEASNMKEIWKEIIGYETFYEVKSILDGFFLHISRDY